MGTRSTILIMNEDKPLCNIYNQFDGYPTGIMEDIAYFLHGMSAFEKCIVDGYNQEDEVNGNFNGMGDLAAQLITFLKTNHKRYKIKVGGYYIVNLEHKESYHYIIKAGKKIKKNPFDDNSAMGNQILIEFKDEKFTDDGELISSELKSVTPYEYIELLVKWRKDNENK